MYPLKSAPHEIGLNAAHDEVMMVIMMKNWVGFYVEVDNCGDDHAEDDCN